jgi:E3 ubiquitin-protein ligase UBR1
MNRVQDFAHEAAPQNVHPLSADGNMAPGLCGYVFEKGEQIYVCDTCAMNDRVLCLPCFHSSNHEGHNVIMYCNSESGGSCDCGDAASWHADLGCSYQGRHFVADGVGDSD